MVTFEFFEKTHAKILKESETDKIFDFNVKNLEKK